MADETRIAQEIVEAGADTTDARIAQEVVEAAASTSRVDISQESVEVGAGTADLRISQATIESAVTTSTVRISQITIEAGRSPEALPPEDNPVTTFTVGAGLGLDWFLALQLSDSGHELRDKTVKSLRATGKFTNGRLKVYGYGPKEDINVEQIEDGIAQKVMVMLDDSTLVQQGKRHQVNVKNAMTHTARIEGLWDGIGIPDRVDEIVYEVARQGIRR